jgi:glycosyltransferase involved in cell wall biosynthesis
MGRIEVEQPRIASLYEGFFSGGARVLHTDVVIGLRERGYDRQSALSINSETFRENTLQHMEDNPSYRRLAAAGIAITSLDRRAREVVDYTPFSKDELAVAHRFARDTDVIVTVKEQPLRLITQLEEMETPVIVGLHRSDPENQDNSLKDIHAALEMGRIASFIATAEKAQQNYVKANIPQEMIHVIRNGIDLRRFQPSPERRAQIRDSLAIDKETPVVTLAARFDTMKDIPLFLASAQQYLRTAPESAILMCGAGMTYDNPAFKEAVKAIFYNSPELETSLYPLGIRGDMEAIYAATDIIACTSRFGETYPLCLMEGLACGAIPVATDVGDTADIVKEGVGLLTSRNPTDIAAAWYRALQLKPQFLNAIAASRLRFDREKMIDAYGEVINRYAAQ